MQVPQNAVVAVADGEKSTFFQKEGDAANVKLEALPSAEVGSLEIAYGARYPSIAANPDDRQQDEVGFVNGVTGLLNSQALGGKIKSLVIVAAPRTLGEMRKSYHKSLSEVLIGELDKDLTGIRYRRSKKRWPRLALKEC